MAHPRRADMVAQLQAELDRPVKVVWDEVNDRHDTGIRAIEAFDPSASHHLVIQDDCVVPSDLLAGIERALRLYQHLGYRVLWKKVAFDPILETDLEKIGLSKALVHAPVRGSSGR